MNVDVFVTENLWCSSLGIIMGNEKTLFRLRQSMAEELHKKTQKIPKYTVKILKFFDRKNI